MNSGNSIVMLGHNEEIHILFSNPAHIDLTSIYASLCGKIFTKGELIKLFYDEWKRSIPLFHSMIPARDTHQTLFQKLMNCHWHWHVIHVTIKRSC